MTAALRRKDAQAADVPALATQLPLAGHSGARIVLHSTQRDSFVRKTAANPAASARLRAQADKQHALWMLGLPFPRVRAQATDAAGIASFDMHYIPGRTIADAAIHGGIFDPGAVAKAVERLMWLFRAQAGLPIEAGIFAAKIAAVTGHMDRESNDLRDTIHACATLLLARDWSAIPESPSHGDLTLENILLTTGKSIAFIDCDDGFASSYWLDFGKLFQDLDGHWCIRGLYRDGQSLQRLNAIQKLERLGREFRRLAEAMDADLPARLPQLAALGLFRAIPYARSDATRRFLCDRIRFLLEGAPCSIP